MYVSTIPLNINNPHTAIAAILNRICLSAWRCLLESPDDSVYTLCYILVHVLYNVSCYVHFEHVLSQSRTSCSGVIWDG